MVKYKDSTEYLATRFIATVFLINLITFFIIAGVAQADKPPHCKDQLKTIVTLSGGYDKYAAEPGKILKNRKHGHIKRSRLPIRILSWAQIQ